MSKKFNIAFNPRTLGLYCFFTHNGQEYYADLCPLRYEDSTECMIFASKDQQVTDWTDLYCKRDIPVTEKSLTKCINDFLSTL